MKEENNRFPACGVLRMLRTSRLLIHIFTSFIKAFAVRSSTVHASEAIAQSIFTHKGKYLLKNKVSNIKGTPIMADIILVFISL